MFCSFCAQPLAPGMKFCGRCGRPAVAAAAVGEDDSTVQDYIADVVSVSVKETILWDKIAGAEILRSPVFRFLSFVAIVPLAITLLHGANQILYGLAVWSGVLWAMLLYRLFSDRDLSFKLALGVLFFTCFIGLPILEVWLILPPDITGWAIGTGILPIEFIGYVFGVGVREEMCKAIPLIFLALFTARMKKPIDGLVLGMMSGIGFAAAENVYYVYKTAGLALQAMKQTGENAYIVMPIYNNVMRLAMTPFLHGCFSAVFGYFLSLASADARRRIPFLFIGLAVSAFIHGLYDTVVGYSTLVGVMVELGLFFMVMTYVLKARGLGSAKDLGGGVFSRTVMMKAVAAPVVRAPMPEPTVGAVVTPLGTPAVVHLGAKPSEPAPALVTPADAAAATGWRLRGESGVAQGRTFPLPGGEIILGRDALRCTVHLEEATVSREHARLVTDPAAAAWRVQLVSRTGLLYVNGQAVQDTLLNPGDRIQVGTSVLVLEG